MREPIASELHIHPSGLIWPRADRLTYPIVSHELGEIPRILEYCTNKKVAVQAGGNCGLWPMELAKHFDQVFTFEPDPTNFYCLVGNTDSKNVRFFNAALGSRVSYSGLLQMEGPTNPGATKLDGLGPYPVIPLDDLLIPECDLLQLDIEGYEYEALRGAETTIGFFKPVIVVELRGHGDDEMVRDQLKHLGYKFAERLNHDEVWVPC